MTTPAKQLAAELEDLRDSLIPIRNAIGEIWRDYLWDSCLIDRLRPMNETLLAALQKLSELARGLVGEAKTETPSKS